MNGNDFVKLALRSPLHVFLGDTLLLTVTGCKSGRKISLPVNYYQEGDTLWVISSRDRKWWRNLVRGGPVVVRVHGRDLAGFGEAIVDETAVASRLDAYVRHMPVSARFLGVRVENGVPNYNDIQRLARERLFVRICPNE